MKKSLIFFVVILMVIMLFPTVSYAKSSLEENYFVPQDRVIEENFFKIGNAIDISGVLKKDAYVFGNIVTVDGVIEGDLMGFASTLKINGEVQGNVRFVAENVIINGKIGKNLISAGNLINVEAGGVVGWDLLAAGNLVDVKGPVGANLRSVGTSLNVNNEIKGLVDARMTEVKFGDQAIVNGDVTYYAEKDLITTEKTQLLGQINKLDNRGWGEGKTGKSFNFIWGRFIFGYLSSLLAAILIIVFARKKVDAVVGEIKNNFWRYFGWGVLGVFAIPLISFLVMFTIVGIPVVLVVLSFYLIILYLARIFFAIVIWRWIAQLLKIKQELDLILAALIGLFIYHAICLIPIVGFFLNLIAGAVSLTAVFLLIRKMEK